jgi:hypothetical protein
MTIRALIVLLTAGNEEVTDKQTANLFRISEALPEDWHTATWGRSRLSTDVILK